ncbi:unnamed protein product [Peronospora farinosa]|uniref:Elicitin n=1 Tax=Peronospora farinosa TaxID=134698 RepID=A0AAV0SSA4_9STRA|nr:unnamed protein product [Peronospora farinosa]
MRCSTFGAVLGALAFGSANALDNCDSNVLVKAYAGLEVNTELLSCMTKNSFSAALDGSVDLTTVNADTAPQQVKAICASDSCKTILSALVSSVNFELTNCIVGNKLVLKSEISTLQSTCTALSAPGTPKPADPTEASAATPSAATAGADTHQQNAPGAPTNTADTTKEVQPLAMPAPTEASATPNDAPAADNKPKQNEPIAPAPAPAPPSDSAPTPASPSDPAPTPASPSDPAPTPASPSDPAPTPASPSDPTLTSDPINILD